MEGKFPLHTSPFTRRYFVNGLGPRCSARPYFCDGGRSEREAGTARRVPRRRSPPGRVRGGAKRRKRFGEGSVPRPPRAPPPLAIRPRARKARNGESGSEKEAGTARRRRQPSGRVRGRCETEEAVRRRKRAPPAACRPPRRRQPSGHVRGGAKRRMRFGEGSGHRPPPGRVPRRVENGSVPFRVLRMPGGGGMIGVGGVKRAGEDETHVHSICAERRRDADRL